MPFYVNMGIPALIISYELDTHLGHVMDWDGKDCSIRVNTSMC